MFISFLLKQIIHREYRAFRKKILLRYQWRSLFLYPMGIILQALQRWHLIL